MVTLESLKVEVDKFTGIRRRRYEIPEGPGLSIITGPLTYSSGGTYELGALWNSSLTYIPEWGDTVIGYIGKEKVNNLLKWIEEHKDCKPEEFKEACEKITSQENDQGEEMEDKDH